MRIRLHLLFLALFAASAVWSIVIRDIQFQGATLFSEDQLASSIQSQPGNEFHFATANEDAARLLNRYLQERHFTIKIFGPEARTNSDNTVSVIFTIDEASAMALETLRFDGNQYISDQQLRDALPTSLLLRDMPSYLETLLDVYTSSGFLFAQVVLDSLWLADNALGVELKMYEGRECRFSRYRFLGNTATREQTLLKISRLTQERTYTPAILDQAAATIARKSYIQSCTITPLDANTLQIEVKEGKMSSISALLGLSSAHSSTITGYVNLEFMNLYGTDRSLAFHWQQLKKDRSSVELAYHEAGPLRYPVSGDISLYREEVDSTYIKSNANLQLYYYTAAHDWGLSASWEQYSPGTRDDALAIERATYRTIGAFWRYNNTDHSYNPTRGQSTEVHYYTRISNLQGKSTPRQGAEASVILYHPINSRTVVSTGIHGKVLENKALSAFDYFYLGGNKNLRGFVEDAFFGYRLGWINAELRYLLSRNSRGFVFVDYAVVQNQNYSYYDLVGTGVGLRLQTRLGLLGIDYGIGYHDGTIRNPLDGILHVGIKTNL